MVSSPVRGQPGQRVFARPRLRWAVWRRWTLANALGEAVGLGVTLLVGILLFTQWEPRIGAVPTAILGVALGAGLEGGIVGTAQWLVLRSPLAGLTWQRWASATAIGAGLAWTLGMIPATVMALAAPSGESGGEGGSQGPEGFALYALAAALGLVAGALLALAQWWVLRRFVPRAAVWLPANAVAWAFGMTLVFAGMGFVPSGGGLGVGVVALIVASVVLAGALVGAIHGLALVWLLRERDRSRTA